MNRLKNTVKTIWEYKWVIFILFAIFSSIVSTIQDFISKDYDSGFNNLLISLLLIEMILLLWSRAETEKLIDIQNEVINSQDKLIKQNEKSIELRDEIIAKKSKWIEEVKKIIEGNSRKMG